MDSTGEWILLFILLLHYLLGINTSRPMMGPSASWWWILVEHKRGTDGKCPLPIEVRMWINFWFAYDIRTDHIHRLAITLPWSVQYFRRFCSLVLAHHKNCANNKRLCSSGTKQAVTTKATKKKENTCENFSNALHEKIANNNNKERWVRYTVTGAMAIRSVGVGGFGCGRIEH